MIHPIVNKQEKRMRALVRIALYLMLTILVASVPVFIPDTSTEFIVRALLCLGLYYIMIRYVDLRSWNESGLILSKAWVKEGMAGLAIGALAMGLIFGIEWVSGSLKVTGFGWQGTSSALWMWPVLAYLIQMISVGFYEELIGRGYILRNMTEGFAIGKVSTVQSAIIAIVLSSAIFGLAHAGNPNVSWIALFNIFVAGIMLAVPFVITGRLSLSIGIHIAWNFFQGGIYGFPVSGLEVRNSLIEIRQGGTELWTGGDFGPEGGLAGLLGIVLALIFSLIYLKIKEGFLALAPDFAQTYKEKRNITD